MPDPTPLISLAPASAVSLFLSGDVMLGRGIDQILPHPGDPQLYELAVSLATTYVEHRESGKLGTRIEGGGPTA